MKPEERLVAGVDCHGGGQTLQQEGDARAHHSGERAVDVVGDKDGRGVLTQAD